MLSSVNNLTMPYLSKITLQIEKNRVLESDCLDKNFLLPCKQYMTSSARFPAKRAGCKHPNIWGWRRKARVFGLRDFLRRRSFSLLYLEFWFLKSFLCNPTLKSLHFDSLGSTALKLIIILTPLPHVSLNVCLNHARDVMWNERTSCIFLIPRNFSRWLSCK